MLYTYERTTENGELVYTTKQGKKHPYYQGVFYTEDTPKIKHIGRGVHESCLRETVLPKVMI